jgi:hypothetical protein
MNFKMVVLTMVVVTLIVGVASAQANSASATTPISAIKGESMSINASGLVQYDLGSLAPQSLNISSYWNLKPARSSVNICVYMDPTTGVMKGSAGNSNVIDQTMVQTNASGSWANINAGTGCAIASGVTVVKTYTLNNAAQRNVSSSSPNADAVQVQLNGVPANYEADTYNGALTVVAYAQ